MPKCTILSQKVKNFSGEGAGPNPIGEGNNPPQASPPRRLASYLPPPAIFFTIITSHCSYGSRARFLRTGRKCYIYFAANSLLFPTVKEFSKLVNSWWSYCEKVWHHVFGNTMYSRTLEKFSQFCICIIKIEPKRHRMYIPICQPL